jgi:16S rRNA (guanine(1405)-N(7))-methyltransferase
MATAMPELERSQPPADDVDTVVQAVLQAPKYAHLDAALVRAVSQRELTTRRSVKAATKGAKSKLHQIGAAYYRSPARYAQWEHQLQKAALAGPTELREACRGVMAHHASTFERLPILDTFYHQLLGDLPPIRSVLDLACGLNPLAIPWMPLAAGATYQPLDIYGDLSAFLARILPLLGVAPMASTWDLTLGAPPQAADVALLLKTLPCLDQLDASAGCRLLAGIRAPVVLLSYPAASLGGESRGRSAHYDRQFDRLELVDAWHIERFRFATETVYRLQRRQSAPQDG